MRRKNRGTRERKGPQERAPISAEEDTRSSGYRYRASSRTIRRTRIYFFCFSSRCSRSRPKKKAPAPILRPIKNQLRLPTLFFCQHSTGIVPSSNPHRDRQTSLPLILRAYGMNNVFSPLCIKLVMTQISVKLT